MVHFIRRVYEEEKEGSKDCNYYYHGSLSRNRCNFFFTAYFEKVNREKYSKSATNVEIEVERCIKERQEKPKYFKNRYDLEVKFDIEGERYETSIVFEDERIYKYEEAIEKETYVDGYEFEVFYEEGNPNKVYIYAKLEEKSGNRYYSVITKANKAEE